MKRGARMPETILGAVTGLTMGIVFVLIFIVTRTSAGVARIEHKLDLLLKHSGVDIVGASADRIVSLVREGKKIEAIRLYREMSGCSLAEAKAHVESLERA
jgi:ribosomal protein L7/L12